MKQRSLLIGLITGAILSGFAACGKPPVACEPDVLVGNRQICSERDSLGFGLEFGTGTLIGTGPQQTFLMRSGGQSNLNVTSVTYSGDSAFAITTVPETLPADITPNKNLLVRIIFTPTQAKLYTGKVTVTSNAENFPTKELALSGCGIPTDGGTSPCYRDGGAP